MQTIVLDPQADSAPVVPSQGAAGRSLCQSHRRNTKKEGGRDFGRFSAVYYHARLPSVGFTPFCCLPLPLNYPVFSYLSGVLTYHLAGVGGPQRGNWHMTNSYLQIAVVISAIAVVWKTRFILHIYIHTHVCVHILIYTCVLHTCVLTHTYNTNMCVSVCV